MNLKALPLLNLQAAPPNEPRLRVNADGSLQVGRADGQVEFNFRFLGLRFEANTRPTASGTVLQLSSEIAPLPYSVEGVAIRRATFAIIDASQALPETRLVVSRRRCWIYCVGRAALSENWQPNDAIIAATRLVLEVRPYLTLLLEVLPMRASAR